MTAANRASLDGDHHLWSVSLPRRTYRSSPARPSPSASVTIAADAWADDAVLVSARARTADGAMASGSVELLATSDGAPTNTTPYWPLPDELLGGLDVAYVGFGAVPGNTVNSQQEPALFDGVTPDGRASPCRWREPRADGGPGG
jgi:hypothetical protein